MSTHYHMNYLTLAKTTRGALARKKGSRRNSHYRPIHSQEQKKSTIQDTFHNNVRRDYMVLNLEGTPVSDTTETGPTKIHPTEKVDLGSEKVDTKSVLETVSEKVDTKSVLEMDEKVENNNKDNSNVNNAIIDMTDLYHKSTSISRSCSIYNIRYRRYENKVLSEEGIIGFVNTADILATTVADCADYEVARLTTPATKITTRVSEDKLAIDVLASVPGRMYGWYKPTKVATFDVITTSQLIPTPVSEAPVETAPLEAKSE